MSSENTTSTKINLAIVGGGIGGLCLAIGLLKYPHIDVQIYEGAHAFSEIGAGVSLGPNSRRTLRLLGDHIWAAFERQATGNGSQYPELKNVLTRYIWGKGPKSGTILADSWADNGQESVHRAQFLDELVRLVPPDITHFKKRLSHLEESPEGPIVMSFEDGTTATADCVVGADGVHSVVRKQLFPESHPSYHPTFSGSVAYRRLIPMDQARAELGEKATHVCTLYVAPGGFVMTYPVDFHKVLNVVAVDTEVDSWDGASVQPADREKMKAKWADWSPAVRSIVKMLDVPGTKVWSLWELSPVPTFCQSSIVMLGDAAHATTPFLGAGAGQAMEDALVLSNLLGHVSSTADLAPAFQAYDRVRRPRSQKVVASSHGAGNLFSMRLPGVMEDEKRFKEDIDERFDWIHNRDVQLQVDQAVIVYEHIRKFGLSDTLSR